jgi:hypothetical protein
MKHFVLGIKPKEIINEHSYYTSWTYWSTTKYIIILQNGDWGALRERERTSVWYSTTALYLLRLTSSGIYAQVKDRLQKSM